MKKLFYLCFLLMFSLVFSSNAAISEVNEKNKIAITDQQQYIRKDQSQELTQNATEVYEPYININNKNIVKFFPENTIGLIYFNFTKENISNLTNLFNYQSSSTKEVKSLKETMNFADAMNFINMLTSIIGPDVCIGIIKPINELQQEPDVILAIKLRSKTLSDITIDEILYKNADSKFEKYKNSLIIQGSIADSSSEKFYFAKILDYLLISNKSDSIKLALDNYSLSKPNVISNNRALEALSYLDKPNIAVILTNHGALMDYAMTRKELTKALSKNPCYCTNVDISKVQVKQSKQPTTKKYSSKKRTVQNKTKTKNLVLKKQQALVKKFQTENDNSLKKISTGEIFPFSYITDIFGKINFYNVISVNLGNNNLEIDSFTPYSTDEIHDKSFKPLFEQLLAVNNRFDFYKSLPADIGGFVKISNLGRIGEIITNIKNPDFQKDVAAFKSKFTSSTGLDIDNDILPLYYDSIVIALANVNNNPEPILLLPNNAGFIEKLDKIASNLNKIINTDVNIEETNINDKYYLKIIKSPSMPVPLAYGKINDAIVIANYDYIRNFIDNSENNQSYFSDTNAFANYQNKLIEKNNILIYIDFNRLKQLSKIEDKKFINNKYTERLNSLLITSNYRDYKVFMTEFILNFK